MGARLSTALVAGQLAASLSRRLGRGGGTVIAGHVVPRIDPSALATVTRRLPLGSVLVSGTNGKTTTSRLISHLLQAAGHRVMHNRAGANLLTGLVTAIVDQTTPGGWPRASVGVFEVDEATLPSVLREIYPRAVLLTNLFRDQLDRYGEVSFVADVWRQSLTMLPTDTTLILNADDPLTADVGRSWEGRTLYFGIDDPSVGLTEAPHASDARICTVCNTALEYTIAYYGHLGHYRCPGCGLTRPNPQVRATAVELDGDRGATIDVTDSGGAASFRLAIPGLYNVYNALAAIACASLLGAPRHTVGEAIQTFTAAFGRLERLTVDDRRLFLVLVKNPVGFGEVLRTLLSDEGRLSIIIGLNDRFADGTDVSWIWDVDFEKLAGRVTSVVCTGTRAEDMAVRIKYALVDPAVIRLEPDIADALDAGLAATAPGGTLHVLPTYSAMLEARRVLEMRGLVAGFWED